MRYPVLSGKSTYYPKQPQCPWCKKRKVFEPHSMFILSGGACLRDKRTNVSGPDKHMEGFLSFHWHGAHNNGEGKNRENFRTIHIVKDVQDGQFDFYFCSVKCFKSWFNAILKDAEKEFSK